MENFEPKNTIEGEFTVEGDALSIFLKEKKLFHGSSNSEMTQFMTSEEVKAVDIIDGVTVGEGLYLTSSEKASMAYAQKRTKNLERRGGVAPTSYEVLVDGLKLLNLKNDANIATFAEKFRAHLLSIMKNEEVIKKLNWMVNNSIIEALQEIQNGISLRNIQKISGYAMAGVFTVFVKELGYEGVVTLEGGEGHENDILTHTGDHDTYVIFNPDKARVLKKHVL